jgi:hypothetical protein
MNTHVVPRLGPRRRTLSDGRITFGLVTLICLAFGVFFLSLIPQWQSDAEGSGWVNVSKCPFSAQHTTTEVQYQFASVQQWSNVKMPTSSFITFRLKESGKIRKISVRKQSPDVITGKVKNASLQKNGSLLKR